MRDNFSVTSSHRHSFKVAPRLLSIQSSVVHGFVGNKAATFPLQCLGYDVDIVPTVTISNHLGHLPTTRGRGTSTNELHDLFQGLEVNDLLKDYVAVLTGYTKSSEHLESIAEVVKKIRNAANAAGRSKHVLYVCDPVMGDEDAYYVPAELRDVYIQRLLPLSDAVTPNHFEVEALSGHSVTSLKEALSAATLIHKLGPKVVLMTGLTLSATTPEEVAAEAAAIAATEQMGSENDVVVAGVLSVVLSVLGDDGAQVTHRVFVPRLPNNYSGCGDVIAVFLTAALEKLMPLAKSSPSLWLKMLECVCESQSAVVLRTAVLNSEELCVVESLDVYCALAKRLSELEETYSTNIQSVTAEQSSLFGVIFDMDGTLTEDGAIDFGAMYTRNGLRREDGDIIHQIKGLPEEAAAAAFKVVYEEEMAAIERQILRPNLNNLLNTLNSNGVRLAIATRNCYDAFDAFINSSLIPRDMFCEVRARDNSRESGFNKPDPIVAQSILREWAKKIGVENPSNEMLSSLAPRVWFVGDSLDDMRCGKGAGCRTALVRTPVNGFVFENHPDLIDIVVDDLVELQKVLCAL